MDVGGHPTRTHPATRRIASVLVALAAFVMFAGCGGGSGAAESVRLGLLLNVTHGPGMIALQREFARGLARLPVHEQIFASGPEEVSALLGGSLDAGYIGPGPYVMAESRAPGRLRLLSGVVTGGQALVARPGSGIGSVADLRDRSVAVPAHGNTQDLTLRLLLTDVGLAGDDQGGAVTIIPVKNAALGPALSDRAVDAALVPEPYAAQLVASGQAVRVASANRAIAVMRIPATLLVVTGDFARANPAAVRALVAANAKAVARAQAQPRAVASAFNAQVEQITGKTMDGAVLLDALRHTQATTRIAPGAMDLMVRAATQAGYLGGPVSPSALIPHPG